MAGGAAEGSGAITRVLVRSPRRGDKARVSATPFHLLARLVALALPARCPGCGVSVDADGRFCGPCWGGLRFLGPPWCAGCNRPFAYDRGEGALCGSCLADPPRHRGVRAAVAYGEVARALALRLKYGGRMGTAETMAAAMARLLPPNSELLVPVPLHRWRLWSRGYNQAALIAKAVGRRGGVPVDPFALIRTRRTPPLKGMGPRARAAAVARAFVVARPAAVAGRAVVLVDDVHTSGATADACAGALLAAGAASVTVLCWARVLDGEERP
jgi:ComF family protein